MTKLAVITEELNRYSFVYEGDLKQRPNESAVRADAAQSAFLLANGKQLVPALVELGQELALLAQSRAAAQGGSRAADIKDAMAYWKDARRLIPKPQRTGEAALYSGLLTEVLQIWEQSHLDTKSGKAPIYVGNIDASTFRRRVREGKIWKDAGVGVIHGEFTHRLQWRLFVPQMKKFETGSAAAFYRAVGAIVLKPKESKTCCWRKTEGGRELESGEGLWDVLFDRFDSTYFPDKPFKSENDLDFRCPDVLLVKLQDKTFNTAEYLREFLRDRVAKRTRQRFGDDGGQFAQEQYDRNGKAYYRKKAGLNDGTEVDLGTPIER